MKEETEQSFSKKSKGYYTDVVWRQRKDGKWDKVWLNGKKRVRTEKFDLPYSD